VSYRTLSPSRVWSPAPADLIAALRALKGLPHGTLLVADDGRVLGWSSAPLKATARAPRTVQLLPGRTPHPSASCASPARRVARRVALRVFAWWTSSDAREVSTRQGTTPRPGAQILGILKK
jgi:hypothetical protein